jgi:hypothetical protein
VTKEELRITSKALERDKALKLDGMVIECFLWVWKVIGKEYTKMIVQSTTKSSFAPGVA